MTPRELTAALEAGKVAPVYLVIGDDEVGKDEVVAALVGQVEDDLRAFNVERFTAGDARPDDVIVAARTLPMLGDRRVVVFSHIERLFKGRKKAADADEDGGAEEAPADPGGLDGYVASPEPSTVLVLVGTDVNRSTKIGKAFDRHAVTIACDGFNVDGFNGAQTALRDAMQFAAERARAAGKRMDAAALTALVERAGPDIVRLRKDLDTLVLFVGDAAAITEADVKVVVGAAQQFDDWAVTNAIAAADAATALRHVQLMVENGSSPFQMLGQLGWWIRSKMPQVAPERVVGAVRALYEADSASKLGRNPQVVLERLVVELCGPRPRSGYGGAGGTRGPAGAGRPFTPRGR
ncbi:MAG TPA: DNA polymerase III subunit delta [Luteitalea sp.]|nr:DNA polymerase III subunit delta [Luteitalea sp.]